MLARMFSARKKGAAKTDPGKQVTRSSNHTMAQVVGFKPSTESGGPKPDLNRDLYSVPKPSQKETMADYLKTHKDGDTFQYITVTGKQEESKESRLARLRNFASPYGKESKPEMRVNGVVLDKLEGKIQIDDLKAHVSEQLLNKEQKRQNKGFRAMENHSFKKPYLHIAKITGEFVPLLSSSADYTDLIFFLQDDRLLENNAIVQSDKIPTNSQGVFELSCDYCIPTSDISQISLCYSLARNIMKEDFQWGAVSLLICVNESDTPYLAPKVEAMAIVKAPFTALETYNADPDHKDVTYTSGHINKFKDLYLNGDIVDNDEGRAEKLKASSYAKSSIRGAAKGQAGPSHLGEQEGWSMLKGMRKPLVGDDQASISLGSGGEEDFETPIQTKKKWEEEQERLRAAFGGVTSNPVSSDTEEIHRPDVEEDIMDLAKRLKARPKAVGFQVQDV